MGNYEEIQISGLTSEKVYLGLEYYVYNIDYLIDEHGYEDYWEVIHVLNIKKLKKLYFR